MLTGRLARDSSWSLGSTVVTRAALFVEAVVLARYLDPSALGVFFLIVAYTEAVQQILDFRVRDALTRYFPLYLAQKRLDLAAAVLKILWWADVAVGLLAFTIVALTATFAADLVVGDPGRAGLIVLYAAGLLFGTVDSASGTVLRVLNRFALSFFVSLGAMVIRLGLMLAVVLADGSLTDLVLVRALSEVILSVIQGAVTIVVLRPVLAGNWRAPMSLLRDRYGELRRFMVSTNLVGVFRMASTKLDTIILGLIATPAAVGLYRLALQFGRVPLLLTDGIMIAVQPRFGHAVAKGRADDLRRVVRASTAVLATVLLPFGLAGVLFSGDVMALIGGEPYRDSGPAFAWCIAGVTLYAIGFWVHPLLITTGNAGDLLRATAVAALLQLGLLFVLVPPFGVAGAGASVGIGWLTTLLLQLRYVRRRRVLADAQ